MSTRFRHFFSDEKNCFVIVDTVLEFEVATVKQEKAAVSWCEHANRVADFVNEIMKGAEEDPCKVILEQPSREKIISKDEITDIKILLETSSSVEEFLQRI